MPNVYCSEIITFNTIALRGAIRDVGRALEIPLEEVDKISKSLDNNEEELRKKYKELFYYADLLNGVIVSVGSHPCGFIVSPISITDNIGTFTTNTSDYPISILNMKEIDSLNMVKLDLLGLDNIELINETCKLANIERLTPDNTDYTDWNVWKSIRDSSLMVFQWEGDYAHSYYKKLFSDETIKKIRKINPNFDYIDLFSVGNGAIRPAGESYRDRLSNGEFNDNGHEALNNLLSGTLGFLCFQEQILDFLHYFCGYSLGDADLVRRGFAKKTGTDQFIPKIKSGFIKTMKDKYNVDENISSKLVEQFIQVIEDASLYLFSKNHSDPYSRIGYACAWLRYYYPLEFLTSGLNINQDNQDKTAKIMEYMNEFTKIKISPIKFRYSQSSYSCDKQTNIIYKGIESIKFLNAKIADELYALHENKYNNFTELLHDISNKTSVNSKQLTILIKLDFFSEFGGSQYLLSLVEIFNKFSSSKVVTKSKLSESEYLIFAKHARETASQFRDLNLPEILKELTFNLDKTADLPIQEKISAQIEFLGYCDYTNPDLDKRHILVLNLDTKYSPRFTGYCLHNGKSMTIKASRKPKRNLKSEITYFENKPFENGDILFVSKFIKKEDVKKTENGWEKTGNFSWWMGNYKKINI